MSNAQARWQRWAGPNFVLPLAGCLLAGMITGAQAQTTSFDPFAPNVIAPQEPTANPTAPKPVAPELPPRMAPMPSAPVQTGHTLSAPTAVPAAPGPTHVTPLAAPTLAPSAPISASTQVPASASASSLTTPPASEMEKLRQLQNALGQSQATSNSAPFEQTNLAPTQPVAAPQVTKPVATTSPSTPAAQAEPAPALTRPLPKPALKEAESVANPAPKPDGNLLEDIGTFFENLFSPATEDTSNDTIESPQTNATHTTPAAHPAPAHKTDKTVADKTPLTSAPPSVDPRLINATFALGSDIRLGQSTSALSTEAQCFTKNRGMVTYCVNPTKWDPTLAQHFDVSTPLYKGERAIIQFDGEIATRLYALFKSDGFNDILRHFEDTYGPATHQFSRTTRTIKKGDVDNPTHIWRKENKAEGLTEVFEIRQIADTRGSLPDLQRGSIRVYFEGARSIFSLSSDLDFMELH